MKVGGTLLNVGLVTGPAHELVKYPTSKDVRASHRLLQGDLCDYIPRAHDSFFRGAMLVPGWLVAWPDMKVYWQNNDGVADRPAGPPS